MSIPCKLFSDAATAAEAGTHTCSGGGRADAGINVSSRRECIVRREEDHEAGRERRFGEEGGWNGMQEAN